MTDKDTIPAMSKTRHHAWRRFGRLTLLALLLGPLVQVATPTAVGADASDPIKINYRSDNGTAPADNFAWRPAGQTQVLNPLGGEGHQYQTAGVETLTPGQTGFDARTALKYGAKGYDAATDPAYTISKYATQTSTPGRFDVTLTAKGNQTTTKTAKPLDIVFVVDLSGSMEGETQFRDPLPRYIYSEARSPYDQTHEDGRFVRSNRFIRPYFTSDLVYGERGKLEQYRRLDADKNDPTNYRFKDKNGQWYALVPDGWGFLTLASVKPLAGPDLNPQYPATTRAAYLRQGMQITLDEIAKAQAGGKLAGPIAVGLVGFSDSTSLRNDVDVPLKPFDSQQATAINAALDPDFSGATWTQNGLERGQQMLARDPADANKILILLTDGEPTYAGADPNDLYGDGQRPDRHIWDMTIASARAIQAAGTHIQGISIETNDAADFKQLTSLKPHTDDHDYIPVASAADIAKNLLADVKFDIQTYTSPDTISDGTITDPLGAQYDYVAGAKPTVTGENLTKKQRAAIAAQVTTQLQGHDRKLTITGLNLGKNQSVKITYPVQLRTTAANFEPDRWYPMNGETTLTPTPETPPVQFGIPSGKAPATKLDVAKQWHDLGERQRPQAITFKVSRTVNGQADPGWEATGTLTKAQGWHGSFAHLDHNGQAVALPQYNDQGQTLSYHVSGEVQAAALTNAGYQLAAIEANTLTNQQYVLNVKKLAKAANINDTPLTGATFTLTDMQTQQTQTVDQDQPLAYLHPGTYTIQETTAPAGYDLDPTPTTFKLAAGKLTTADGAALPKLPTAGPAKDGLYLSRNETALQVTFVKTDQQTIPTLTLKLQKTDADTHRPLSGATFTVPGLTLHQQPDGTSFVAGELTLGRSYTVQETRPPDGYVGLRQALHVTAATDGTVRVALGAAAAKVVPLDGQTAVALGHDVSAKVIAEDATSRQLLITVGNRRRGVLPHTGTDGMLKLLVASGTLGFLALILVVIAWWQRRKEAEA